MRKHFYVEKKDIIFYKKIENDGDSDEEGGVEYKCNNCNFENANEEIVKEHCETFCSDDSTKIINNLKDIYWYGTILYFFFLKKMQYCIFDTLINIDRFNIIGKGLYNQTS